MREFPEQIDSNNNNTESLEDLLGEQALELDMLDALSMAKAKPQRREFSNFSSSIIPMNDRKWIDIELGEFFSAFEISRKVVNFFAFLKQYNEKNYLQNHFPQIPYWSDDSLESMFVSRRRRRSKKEISVLF